MAFVILHFFHFQFWIEMMDFGLGARSVERLVFPLFVSFWGLIYMKIEV